MNQEDLLRINTMTKYPSIPTYHRMADRGVLTEERIDFGGEEIHLSEKIDGTNARIILLAEDGDSIGMYFIGSREELLYAQGDLIRQRTLEIVSTCEPVADDLMWQYDHDGIGGITEFGHELMVIYGEVYGVGVNKKHKTYIGDRDEHSTGFRVFDIAVIPDWTQHRQKTIAELALWRDLGGPMFLDVYSLRETVAAAGLDAVPVIDIPSVSLPRDHQETLDFLTKHIPTSRVMQNSSTHEPEGMVVRSHDRRTIAKIRYEDYRRNLRKKSS